jgi:hypothetical protein
VGTLLARFVARKLGKEGSVEVAKDVFNHLCEALGAGPVEELCSSHLGVGVK